MSALTPARPSQALPLVSIQTVRPLLACLASLALLTSCAGAATGRATSAAAGPVDPLADPPELDATPGFSVRVRPLPTPGRVQLALFLDAGSLDASPPQVATLAAHALERRLEGVGGFDPVRARVTPDATRFSLDCNAEDAERCARHLGTVLEAGTIQASELAEAHATLRSSRVSAAGDPVRNAEVQALQALLGGGAAGLFPLGQATDDAGATPAAVQAFIDAHDGSNRALLLAQGDLAPDALERVRETLGDLPHSAEARRARELQSADNVAVEVGHANAVAVAVRARDGEHARHMLRLVQDPVFATGPEPLLPNAAAFELRSAALLLLSLPADRLQAPPLAAATRLAALALRAADAPVTERPSAAPESGLGWGDAWAARQPPGTSQEPAGVGTLGLGLSVAGGRGDALGEEDPDQPLRSATRTQLAAALAQAQRLARPWTGSDASLAPLVTPSGASSSDEDSAWQPLTLAFENGGRLHSALSPTGRGGVLVAFEGGPGEDSESLHGRAALSAAALASRCRRLLGAMGGVRVSTLVHGDRVGLWFEDTSAGWPRLLDVAARCALELHPAETDLHEAKRELILQLGPDGSDLQMRGWVAEALSPGQPGSVAPNGSADRLDAIRLGDVQRALSSLRVGRRSHVVVMAPAPPAVMARRVAPRLASLDAGARFDPTRRRAIADSPHSVAWAGATLEHARVVVAFRDPVDPDELPAGAAAFTQAHLGLAHATAVAARLRAAGMSVRWAEGSGGAYGHWSAVAIDTTLVNIADLPARVEGALREPLALPDLLHTLRSAPPTTLREFARRILPELDVARRMRSGPRYIIARPQPAEAMRRRRGR